MSSVAKSVTVGKAAQAMLTVVAPDTATFGDVVTLSSTGGSGTGEVSFDASGAACSIPLTGPDAGKLVITSGTGTCSVTATKAADADHDAVTSAAEDVTVGKAPQATLIMTSQSTGTFGETITLTSSGGSGEGATTYVASGDACAISALDAGKLLITSGTGDCSVTATKAADADHDAVSSAAQTITVSKAAQAPLEMTSKDTGTYGEFITLTTSGGTGNGDVTFTASGTACAITTVDPGTLEITAGSGTCSVSATKAADANYDPVTSDPQTITVSKAPRTPWSSTPLTTPPSATSSRSAPPAAAAAARSASPLPAPPARSPPPGRTPASCHHQRHRHLLVTATKAADDNYEAISSAPQPSPSPRPSRPHSR